jgi:hypothetical protein
LINETFAHLVALENEILRRDGGSMALAVIEVSHDAVFSALPQVMLCVQDRERLMSTILSPKRIAVCKRMRGSGAGHYTEELLAELESAGGQFRGVGCLVLEGVGSPAFAGAELLRIGEMALERAIADASGEAQVDICTHLGC